MLRRCANSRAAVPTLAQRLPSGPRNRCNTASSKILLHAEEGENAFLLPLLRQIDDPVADRIGRVAVADGPAIGPRSAPFRTRDAEDTFWPLRSGPNQRGRTHPEFALSEIEAHVAELSGAGEAGHAQGGMPALLRLPCRMRRPRRHGDGRPSAGPCPPWWRWRGPARRPRRRPQDGNAIGRLDQNLVQAMGNVEDRAAMVADWP